MLEIQTYRNFVVLSLNLLVKLSRFIRHNELGFSFGSHLRVLLCLELTASPDHHFFKVKVGFIVCRFFLFLDPFALLSLSKHSSGCECFSVAPILLKDGSIVQES